ncbi:hypothetical protein [Brevundimonas lutea]|uniref:hypothetical protein n=1 Tax=Brevundimonas lutea TaxID=2293980 RepID=UPI0013CF3B5D|nr:hypothetical protein [Brevundimonas lutea]
MTVEDPADLAYLKRMVLAGRGRAAPALVLMAVFGLVYGVTFLLSHLLVVIGWDRVEASGWWPVLQTIFIANHMIFLAALVWTGWRYLQPDRPRVSRAAGAVWSGAFAAFVAVTVAILLFSRDEPPSDEIYVAYFHGPVLLVLWGMAWWATAFLTERRWLLLVSAGSFGFALAIAWVGNTWPMMALIGASLLLLAFLPAVILLREGRA